VIQAQQNINAFDHGRFAAPPVIEEVQDTHIFIICGRDKGGAVIEAGLADGDGRR